MPAELWAEAVEVARVEGPDVTARTLRLDRLRLEARMKTDGAAAATEVGSGFVELDAGRLGLSPSTVTVRFVDRDGDRIEVELGATATLDVAALAETFWRRPR